MRSFQHATASTMMARGHVLPRPLRDASGTLLTWTIVAFAFTTWPFIWYESPWARAVQVACMVGISVLYLVCGLRPRINAFTVVFALYLAILLVSTALSDHEEIRVKTLSRAVIYVLFTTTVLAMSSMRLRDLCKAANAVTLLYILSALPSVVLFLATLLGSEIPYALIELGGRGPIYRLYPLGVVSESAFLGAFPESRIIRINGFSEEPGVLGTFVVFFIILNRCVGPARSRNRREFLLHILGTLSMSLFYYLSVAALIVGSATRIVLRTARRLRIAWLDAAWLVLPLVLVPILVWGIRPGDPLYYLTLARFLLSESGGLAGNSRAMYDLEALRYVRDSDIATVLIGHGPGSNSLDPSARFASWAAELFDSGIFGLALLVLFLGYALVRFAVRQTRLDPFRFFLIVPAVASLYQRPDLVSPIVVLFWITVVRLSAGWRGGGRRATMCRAVTSSVPTVLSPGSTGWRTVGTLGPPVCGCLLHGYPSGAPSTGDQSGQDQPTERRKEPSCTNGLPGSEFTRRGSTPGLPG